MSRVLLAVLPLSLLLAVFAGGCAGDKAAHAACPPVPAALGVVIVPSGFPHFAGLTLTGDTNAGTTMILSGHRSGDVNDALKAVKSALASAPGYTVTSSERHDGRAAIGYSSGSDFMAGEVQLVKDCNGTSVTFTAPS